MFISKKLYFFRVQAGRGVKNVKRSNLFQDDGVQLLFSIELVVFQGGSGLPVPPLDSRIAYVHVSMFVAF